MDQGHIDTLQAYKDAIEHNTQHGTKISDMARLVADMGIYIANYEIERAKDESPEKKISSEGVL